VPPERVGVGSSAWHGLELAARQARHEQEGRPVFNDLVTRLFTPDAPNRLWLTDLTEHWRAEDKLYYCIITHARSHQIVDYSLNSTRQRTRTSSLTRSSTPVQRRGDLPDCILHTDSETVGAGVLGGPDPHSDRRARMLVPGVLRGS